MIDFESHKKDPLFYALKELNKAMIKHDCPPITLNVVGGFALMIHEDRLPSEYTDIDFAGPALSAQVKQMSVDIAHKMAKMEQYQDENGKGGLEDDWLNNDLLLSGTSLEDMEFSTGKLHFHPAYELDKIKINVLDERELLRMKLIALDTSLVELESNQDFTRAKDLKDIAMLIDKLGMTVEQAMEENEEFLINENTQTTIQLFIDNNQDIGKTIAALKEHMEYGEYMRLKEKYEPEEALYGTGESLYGAEESLLDDRGISGMLDDLFSH